jgi:hypothetical protein
VGSILIGGMLGGVACFTINKNRGLLGQVGARTSDATADR